MLRALWQLIGSTGDNAQEGGFSIMVTGGFGGSAQYMLGLKQINEGTLEYKQSQTLLDMSMVVGYRFGATTIAYGGPYVTLGNISGTSTVRAAPGAAGTDYAVTSSGNQIGFHLGTQFALSDVFSIILEVAYNQISWQNISMQNQIKGGLSTAFKF